MKPQAEWWDSAPETESRGSKSFPRGDHAEETAVEMGCRRKLRGRRPTAAAGDDGERGGKGGLERDGYDLRQERV